MQYVHLAVEILGLVSIVCGLLAKYLKPGKARDIARDLGFRAGDAAGVVKSLAKAPVSK
jgi:hypothetical protein